MLINKIIWPPKGADLSASRGGSDNQIYLLNELR